LRHRHKACLNVIRALLLMLALLAQPTSAMAALPAPLNQFITSHSGDNRSIEFTDIDIVISNQTTIPASGWKRMKTGEIWDPKELKSVAGAYHAVWGRVRFDRAVLGQGPMAINTQDNREQILVYVNGTDIFRNYTQPTDIMQSWYRPYHIPIPLGALRPGTNEIIFRVGSDYTVGVGKITVGPNVILRTQHNWQNLARITGVIVANWMMLLLGASALLMWWVRRDETELLFLALSASLWMLRNYHFFAEHTPVGPELFALITVYSLYFAIAASAGFCLSFLRIPRHRFIIGAIFGFGVLLCALRWIFDLPDTVIYLAAFAIALTTSALALLDLRRFYSLEHWLLSMLMATFTIASVHDIGRVANIWWQGLGFYVQPYVGFIFCFAFLLSFGRRALAAFVALGSVNETLEVRIADARAELAASESKRRALEVDRAIVTERERLMREMHDGIGSNLVTALAIAERQDQPPATIKTLKRAISDLKITVDSLAPGDGDLVALIGNLRHRMASDLKAAGLISKWEVGACNPLPWLDATNALHVLRIFQEAISNVIAHSRATLLRIGCHEESRDGVPGLAAFVADNGCGFDADDTAISGKGLSNMRARTESMHGQFTMAPIEQGGTQMTVWFPYERPETSVVATEN
jgi:signal transduction histidine kinase